MEQQNERLRKENADVRQQLQEQAETIASRTFPDLLSEGQQLPPVLAERLERLPLQTKPDTAGAQGPPAVSSVEQQEQDWTGKLTPRHRVWKRPRKREYKQVLSTHCVCELKLKLPLVPSRFHSE